MKLTAQERSTYKRALLAAGIKTRTMNDAELALAFEGINHGAAEPSGLEPPVPAEPIQPAPEPEKKKTAKSKGNGKTEAGKLAGSLEALISEALNRPQGIDEGAVIDLIKKHGTVETIERHIVTVNQPEGVTHTIEGAHPRLADLITILSVNENCYLVGEAGSGKTTLAKQAADALKKDFYFTGAITDKFELLGYMDAGGVYHETPLYLAVKNGGVFLIDEVDCSQPAAIKAFNTSLENGYITFPNGEHFEIDKQKTMFIFAANTVGTGANRRYVGGYELDRSTLDRFIQINVEYDRAIENGMASSAWIEAGGLENSLSNAASWAGIVQDFRTLLHDRQILALCTPRATRHGAKLLARGWEVEQVKKVVLYKHLSEDQLRQLGVK